MDIYIILTFVDAAKSVFSYAKLLETILISNLCTTTKYKFVF